MKPFEKSKEIVSAIRATVRPEQRKELWLTIASLLDLIRSEDGCRTYRFYGEDGDQNTFILIGEWETSDAWDQHRNSNNFAVLIGSLKLLGIRPDVDLQLLSHVAPIEMLTRAKRTSLSDVL
jgi:quinol monooxygenase YgiN